MTDSNRALVAQDLLCDAADYLRARSCEIVNEGGSAEVAADGMRIALALEAALVPAQEVAGLVEASRRCLPILAYEISIMISSYAPPSNPTLDGIEDRRAYNHTKEMLAVQDALVSSLAALSPPSQGVEKPHAGIFRTSPGQCFECEADLQPSTALRGAFVCLACNPEIAHPDVSVLVERLEPFARLYSQIMSDHGVEWFADEGQVMRAALAYPVANNAVVWRHFRLAAQALAAFQSRQEGK